MSSADENIKNKRKLQTVRYKTSSNRDQLNMIFNILGTPEESAVEKLHPEDTRRYVKCFKKRSSVPLRDIDVGGGAIEKTTQLFTYRHIGARLGLAMSRLLMDSLSVA